MPVETTYTSLRARLASVLDQVANDREVVIVRRRGAKDVALIPAALRRATGRKGKPESVAKLRREVGLGASH